MHITTAEQEENPDWRQGYGFQFWRSRHGYRGDGAYGQYMIILPEADAVIAITSQSPDMQGVLDAVWAHLLPAFDGAGAVPAGAWVPGPLVLAPSATSATTSRSFPEAVLTPSDAESETLLRSVRIQDGCLVLVDDGAELTVTLGVPGSWTATGPVCTDHSWVDGALLAVDVVFAETPHRLILRLDPAASQFSARWQAQPLHRVPLAQMRMPRPDRTLEAHPR